MTNEVDFKNTTFRNDPHGTFTSLRSQGAFSKISDVDAYLVTHHKECELLLKDPRVELEVHNTSLFSKNHPLQGYFSMRRGLMLFSNPPRHDELKDPAQSSFTARSVKKYRPIIQELSSNAITELKGKLSQQKSVDFISEISIPFVSKVICQIVGMPEQDHEKLARMTQAVADGLDPLGPRHSLEKAGLAYQEFQSYMEDILAQDEWRSQNEEFSQTFLGDIAKCPHMLGDFKSQADLISTTVMLLSAGHLTTNHSLSLSLMTLLEDETYRPILTECSTTISPLMIEELFRYHCPAQITRRTLNADLSIGDKKFSKGQALWIALASANRDEQVFKNSQELDFQRRPNPHLSFGGGTHFCIGAHLARLQLITFLETLQGEIPNLRIEETGITHDPNIIFRGLKQLRVSLEE